MRCVSGRSYRSEIAECIRECWPACKLGPEEHHQMASAGGRSPDWQSSDWTSNTEKQKTYTDAYCHRDGITLGSESVFLKQRYAAYGHKSSSMPSAIFQVSIPFDRLLRNTNLPRTCRHAHTHARTQARTSVSMSVPLMPGSCQSPVAITVFNAFVIDNEVLARTLPTRPSFGTRVLLLTTRKQTGRVTRK